MPGGDSVLEQTLRHRRAALLGYASLFLPHDGAEDLVQEALVRTFARPRAIPDVDAAEAYVKRAIRTVFLDSYRRNRWFANRRHLFVEDASRRGPEQSVSAGIDVAAALEALPPRQRACVVLRFFDDLPVAAIAAELGLSDGSVKRYLSEGTAALRAALSVGDDEDIPTERATAPAQEGC